MGYIGTYGTETTAPEYHCNAMGTPGWSGKKKEEFTSEIEEDLRQFIVFEASRKGHNDFIQDCIGENQKFFNEHFLDGWPHTLWLYHYERGVNNANIRRNK